jgi:hypothetical protein
MRSMVFLGMVLVVGSGSFCLCLMMCLWDISSGDPRVYTRIRLVYYPYSSVYE